MFRLSTNEEGAKTVITVDGQILGDYVEVVEAWCNDVVSKGRPVQLFLRDVSSVDQSGYSMLRRLANKGIQMLATGVYTSYLVEAIHSAAASPGVGGRTAGQGPKP